MRADRWRWIGVGAPAMLLMSAALAGDTYHLDRASIDHAGGGIAQSNVYELVVAIGQHDAGPISQSDTYRYAGGVFARVPADVLFKNGFEGD